jgi:hypothetical protein
MRTTAALISTAALLLTLAACSDGSGDSGSPADKATASSCMTGIDSLFTADWSQTTPPETRPPGCESLSVTEYRYAYRSAMAAIAQDGEDFYNENDGLPSDWPS